MGEKQKRLHNANELIKTIATCGRKFFCHSGRVSRFETDGRGRIWFVDSYDEARIYTHYTQGRWRGFSEGGTLRALVIALRDFISTGKQLGFAFGPWPDWYCDGDLWGYGDDMQTVRNTAGELGIINAHNTAMQPNLLRSATQIG